MASPDMSQVKAPREYKFVGAFSRKRRSRNGAASSRSSTGPKRRANAASKTQDESAHTLPDPKSDHKINEKGNVRERQTSVPPTSSTATPAPDFQASLAKASSTCEQNDNALENQLMLDPSNESVGQGSEVDWSFSSLMNPFLDMGSSSAASFHSINDICQLSADFGPDVPLVQIDDASTETSPQDDYMEPALLDARMSGASHAPEPPVLDEIFLLPLSPQQAPCNISTTITHLLARCMYRVEFLVLCPRWPTYKRTDDQEFCVTPLTHDFDANPFRSDVKTGRGSLLLLHSILALSYKHLNRDTGSCANEARVHKRKALQMLRDADEVSLASSLEATLLDAVLILMTLDVSLLPSSHRDLPVQL